MVMKANQIKPSALLATVVLGDVSPLVTERGSLCLRISERRTHRKYKRLCN